jgi:carbamoyl-phosphate synthase large subunit
MNVQFAVKWEAESGEQRAESEEQAVSPADSRQPTADSRPVLYVIEVNPRASRTVPFVAKATGMPVAKIAAKVMAGVSLAEQGVTEDPVPSHVSVKESVLPFIKFTGVDIVLGPEMRSTGEVMGISSTFSIAFAKSQLAAGTVLPRSGNVFVSVADKAKEHVVDLARCLHELGYGLLATEGTARVLAEAGIPTRHVKKIEEGHPNLLDFLGDGDVALVMNTPVGKGARTDEGRIRAAAVSAGVPCLTTIEAAAAAVMAIAALRDEEMQVQALQDRFGAASVAAT